MLLTFTYPRYLQLDLAFQGHQLGFKLILDLDKLSFSLPTFGLAIRLDLKSFLNSADQVIVDLFQRFDLDNATLGFFGDLDSALFEEFGVLRQTL